MSARAWAYLSRVAEPPCAELAALVDAVGPVEAADRIRRGQVDDGLAQHTESRRAIDCAADDLELLARRGGRSARHRTLAVGSGSSTGRRPAAW